MLFADVVTSPVISCRHIFIATIVESNKNVWVFFYFLSLHHNTFFPPAEGSVIHI